MVGLLGTNRRRSFRLLSLLLVLLAGVAVRAQGATSLTPGEPVPGTLNNNTIAQVFTFNAVQGEVVTLVATNDSGLALALLLTDAQGGLIAQARDVNAIGETRLSATLPLDGLYFVTVLPVAGVDAPTQGSYQIVLEAESAAQTPVETTVEATEQPLATPEVTQVNTTSGIQVTVTWDTTADMDLEVRDPVGGALFFNNPEIPSGGTFGANINGGCQNLVGDAPKEEIAWPPGGVPAGSYETLVYYQQDCEGSGPVAFTINAAVDGTPAQPIEGTLLEGQVFIGSFFVNPDGTAQTSARSGVRGEESLPDAAASIIRNAQPVEFDTPVQGFIAGDQPYQSYTFQAQANEFVTISMNANSGSLDPYVILLDPSGNTLYFNDDAGEGITDALLTNSRLIVPGAYTVVATRYGLAIGGTEGGYELSLTRAAAAGTPVVAAEGTPAVLPAEVTGLQLPQGNIEVTLLWNTGADLQLLVRDPAGESVFDDTPSIRSGGRLGAAGNVNCAAQADTSPVSYIYWPTTITPRAGSYEIDVWFQNECNDTTPINFTLYASVFGQQVLTESLSVSDPFLQGDHFMTSFTLDANGAVTVGEGGIIGLDSLDWQNDIENATVLADGDAANGSITVDNKFDLYVFQGQSGDVVSIALTAAPDTNLDTNLYLASANGVVVAQNDDAVTGENTNSLIDNFTLPSNGQYIIIATHYGEQYGITSGAYTLTLDISS